VSDKVPEGGGDAAAASGPVVSRCGRADDAGCCQRKVCSRQPLGRSQPRQEPGAGTSLPRNLISPVASGRSKDYFSIFLSADNRREILVVVML